MKRLLSLAFLLLPLVAIGQHFTLVGGKAGLGPGFMVGPGQPSGPRYYGGSVAGGFLSYEPALEGFGLRTELQLAWKGGENANDLSRYTYQRRYAELPVSVLWFPASVVSMLRPYLYGGASVGFLTYAHDNQRGVTYGGVPELAYDAKPITRSLELSALAGAGVQLSTWPGHWIMLDLRFVQGLSSSSQAGSIRSSTAGLVQVEPQALRTATVQVCLLYGFRL